MLPAATWFTAAALVVPVAVAALSSGPVSADPSDPTSPSESPSMSTSPSPIESSPVPTEPAPEISPTQPTPTISTPTISTTPELDMETQLRALGLPTGEVDGKIDPRTRRAVCVFRDLNGLRATRKLPGTSLMTQISEAEEIPLLPRRLFGVKALVSLTCQATYVTNKNGVVVRVLPVSTGKDLGYHATRTGFKRVYWKYNAWQHSSLFPEPDGRPGLYRPIYFDRGIAFHGVRHPVRTFPQSHGCVRTWPKHQDWLWKQLRVRDKVFVYGNYWREGTASLGGYGRG